MGTNFYFSSGGHIGKRSAAGWYCWDCKQTFCADGEKYVHYCKLPPNEEEKKKEHEHLIACRGGLSKNGFSAVAENEWSRRDVTWHKKCPKCGKRPPNEEIDEGAIGRELGFNKSLTTKKGVTSCCSFSWAMPKKEALRISKTRKWLECVRDEYGREYTHKEFIAIINDCPIEFTDMIGTRFS